jgi:hypothetical protein
MLVDHRWIRLLFVNMLGPQPVIDGDDTHFDIRIRPPTDPENR